jgi:hypothetical protein
MDGDFHLDRLLHGDLQKIDVHDLGTQAVPLYLLELRPILDGRRHGSPCRE